MKQEAEEVNLAVVSVRWCLITVFIGKCQRSIELLWLPRCLL